MTTTTTTTVGGKDRAGNCPLCFGPTTTTIPGYARCRACGWQGHDHETEDRFHGED